MTAERVAIIGGGIAGLAVALALKKSDREITIIERDPEPPAIAPESAFDDWSRPGVPQFRHAHIVLARAQTLMRDHHPELLAELREAGLEFSALEEVLPWTHVEGLKKMPGDDDLLHLWGRRATLEYVIRQHVGRLPHVRFVHSARVEGLVTETLGRDVRLRGVEFVRNGTPEVVEADFVVDASGKRTKSPRWLEALGVRVTIDSKPSGFVYACRHYRLKHTEAAPPRRNGGGNFDYLGYATFYAEHGNYALTFGCPVEDKELAGVIHHVEGFDALCDRLPVLKKWASESDVRTKVLGAGLFENRWTHFGAKGGNRLLGFFAVGDSHMETNPMYGRGCASAFWQAHVLAEVLDAQANPEERALDYERRTRTLLKPHFDISVATDRMYHVRARLSRGLAVPLGARLLNYAYEEGWVPALHTSPLVAREMVGAMQMRDVSSVGVRLAVALQILKAIVVGWFRRGKSPFLVTGPPRTEFLHGLLPHEDGPDSP
jgi:2-polyprenyl-6-methoxyphenol hydroxylase-like FAD-dependent oxidoreductase